MLCPEENKKLSPLPVPFTAQCKLSIFIAQLHGVHSDNKCSSGYRKILFYQLITSASLRKKMQPKNHIAVQQATSTKLITCS